MKKIAQNNLISEFGSDQTAVEELREIENCEGFKNSVVARVSPSTIPECLRIMAVAREFGCAVYPVATGKNWGFGAGISPVANTLILDLSGLNAISELDENYGSVRLQPGVTQKQLHDFLCEAGSDFRIDVTGSGVDTSVLGNALERGVGYQALRHEHVLSLTVLLADGSIVETGYARFEGSDLDKCLSYGLGPSLGHLFTQSNFGIVLGATYRLMRKSEYTCAISFSIEDERDLGAVSALIARLFDDSIITGIPKIFDRRRCEVTFCSKFFAHARQSGRAITRGEVEQKFNEAWGKKTWTFATSLRGPRSVVDAKLSHIEKSLRGLASLRVIDAESVERADISTFDGEIQNQFDRLVLGYLQGVPSNDALRSAHWDVRDYDETAHQPEAKDYGFLFVTPLVPNESEHLRNFLRIYREIGERYGIEPAMTLNYLCRSAIEAVISFNFDKKNPFATKKAHGFKNALVLEFLKHGYAPYRLDTQSMASVFSDSSQSKSWQTVCEKIKNALDPQDLIAPGRYAKK